MVYAARNIKTKDGRTVVLRNAEESDADMLLTFLRVTAGETRSMANEPEEITMTVEQEQAFIRRSAASKNELMILSEMDGRHVGLCAMRSVGAKMRFKHRCSVSIALYKEFWGLGIAKQMMEAILAAAKAVGYEQAELEVVEENDRAYKLYEKLGFVPYGKLPNNMKYKDGSYADTVFMVKKL